MISGRDKHLNNFITNVEQEIAGGSGRRYYDDPTTMGFNIFFEFDSEFSPLLNLSDKGESAVRYLEAIDEPERAEKLREFITRLRELVTIYPYFIEGLAGLENTYDIDETRAFEHERELVITTKESIDFRVGGMIEAYDFATVDILNRRNMLPENLRNFRFVVIVSEIRKFRTFIKQLAQDATTPEEAVFPHTMKDISKNLATFVYIFDNCTLEHKASNSFADLNNTEPEMYTNTFSIKTGAMTTDHRIDFLDLVSNVGSNGERADLKSVALEVADQKLQGLINKFNTNVENVIFRSSNVPALANVSKGHLKEAQNIARGLADLSNPVTLSTALAGKTGLYRGLTNAVSVGSSDSKNLGATNIERGDNTKPELGTKDVGGQSSNATKLGTKDVGDQSENASELGNLGLPDQSENASELGNLGLPDKSENASVLGNLGLPDQSDNATTLGIRDVGEQSENASTLGIRDVGELSDNASELGDVSIPSISDNSDGLGEVNVGSTVKLTVDSGKATSLSSKDVGDISTNQDDLGNIQLPERSNNPKDLDSVDLPTVSKNVDDLNRINVGEISNDEANLGKISLSDRSDNSEDLGTVNLPNKSNNPDSLDSVNLPSKSENSPDLNSVNVGDQSTSRLIPSKKSVGDLSDNANSLGGVNAGEKSKNALRLGRQNVGTTNNEVLKPARLDLNDKSKNVQNLGAIKQNQQEVNNKDLGKLELGERDEKGIKSLDTVYVGKVESMDFTKLFLTNVFNYDKAPISAILMAFTASNLGNTFGKTVDIRKSESADYDDEGKISGLGTVTPVDKRKTSEEDC